MAAIVGGRVAMIVFAKPPRPGEAKTRLATVLGEEAAARLARAFIVDTWSLVRSLEWADPLLATTDVDDPFWSTLPGITVWDQGDGDLGDRMERALRQALETHSAAMIIGSDIPGLPVAALDQARAELKIADVVMGPSDDGGFYLIGCRRALPPRAFKGVEWSTSRTREETEARLQSLGRTVAQATPWFDVDDVDALHRLRRLGESLRRMAPVTARVLDGLVQVP